MYTKKKKKIHEHGILLVFGANRCDEGVREKKIGRERERDTCPRYEHVSQGAFRLRVDTRRELAFRRAFSVPFASFRENLRFPRTRLSRFHPSPLPLPRTREKSVVFSLLINNRLSSERPTPESLSNRSRLGICLSFISCQKLRALLGGGSNGRPELLSRGAVVLTSRSENFLLSRDDGGDDEVTYRERVTHVHKSRCVIVARTGVQLGSRSSRRRTTSLVSSVTNHDARVDSTRCVVMANGERRVRNERPRCTYLRE